MNGTKVVFVGRWVTHHGPVKGNASALDARGLKDPCAGQGSDRIPPGTGTQALAMWLPIWAEDDAVIVVIDSIASKVLGQKSNTVVEAADGAGFRITVLELSTSEDVCQQQVLSRESVACAGLPEEMKRSSEVVARLTKQWLSDDNPWRNWPFKYSNVSSSEPAICFNYVLCSQESAVAALQTWDWGVIHPAATACGILNPHAPVNDGAPEVPVVMEDAVVIEDVVPESAQLEALCFHCDAAFCTKRVRDLRHKEPSCVTCVGCLHQWHWQCYHGSSLTGGWSVLCESCCYFAEVGRIRPTDCLKVGQILSGLGTGMMQLCELGSVEGLPLKRLSNVYSVEWEPSAVRYVMHLGNQEGYAPMSPTTMHTDFLSDILHVDDLPHVHILFLTLMCAKFSSVNNGHANVAKDLADPNTRRTTLKCCQLLRRKKPAATIIIMENVMGWEKSESLTLIMHAAAAGGYRELLRWKCRVNEDLGLPEHRDRFMLVLAHKSHVSINNEVDEYNKSLLKHCSSDLLNAPLELSSVFLDWETPGRKRARSGELTLNDCLITAADLQRACTLTVTESQKVTDCKNEILARAEQGIGEASISPDNIVTCSSWYTGDLCHSGMQGWSSLHKTIGRIPTVLASHGARGIYCFHKSRDRFMLVPELMVARGFSDIPIKAGCDQFCGSDEGWSTLGWLVGGAAPPTAYRALLQVLWDLAPGLMRNPVSVQPGDIDLGVAFTDEDLEFRSLSARFQATYLLYPGAGEWQLRDFGRTQVLSTSDWRHVYVKDFDQPYTRVKVPGEPR
jgi:site-specific DNA-cytosine methylase